MTGGAVQGDADLAALGAVLAEPARAKIVMTLLDGRALPASVLATEAGVAPSTASSHLARLLDAGLVTCRPQGRHRYYELAGPQIAELVETMARLARPARSGRSARAPAPRRCEPAGPATTTSRAVSGSTCSPASSRSATSPGATDATIPTARSAIGCRRPAATSPTG